MSVSETKAAIDAAYIAQKEWAAWTGKERAIFRGNDVIELYFEQFAQLQSARNPNSARLPSCLF
jgi:acyl-CoA reductase-like NAD-dependent aldehyde dehydrogenase